MTPLVTTDWLANELDAGDLVVIDATLHLPGAQRDAAAEYIASHIPGARFLDLATLADPHSAVPSAIPTRAQFQSRMRRLGVPNDARIVLYDASDLRSSCRAWFIMRHYGRRDVAILDGGFGKWGAEGRIVDHGASSFEESGFVAGVGECEIRQKADMLLNIDSGAEQVADARDAARFTGDAADAVHDLPGGHIPGARNLFFRDLLTEDGTFRPVEELEEVFRNAGIDPAKPLAASCGSGVTASVVLFAHYLLGHTHGALYDGSWSEWGADPATPKATGPA
ncbi:sulfurtransferase [Aurantiacibacter gangjinensis]|uniref:3-mercaptopyruvate sulfurtransferase n=1 Tax=Aurantiacibacter gangjinensis TaxID=502682 RepID=A0A0G9MS93_9SPHN|nr:sulfurtransferase [Aurantiacibacter gangjinensis]KLE33429.1 3-mercaptopyruvate sulfurtransferase [Aurantiacibacter gangjinensis]